MSKRLNFSFYIYHEVSPIHKNKSKEYMRVTVIILFLLLMTGGIQAQNKKTCNQSKANSSRHRKSDEELFHGYPYQGA